jgi:four helix bundle protein
MVDQLTADFAVFAETGLNGWTDLDGTPRAADLWMATAQKFEELEAYQLSKELRDTIFKLTEAGPMLTNLKFRDQIRRSSSSAPANVSEGFGRFKPREFAHFARIARASLLETRNHIEDGRTKNYFSEEEATRLFDLQVRATKATTGLLRYLESCKGQAPTGWDCEP